MSNKTIYIRYDSQFANNKIYELNYLNNRELELRFNSCTTTNDIDLKCDMLLMLVKSGLFNNNDVIISQNEKLNQFNIVISRLIWSHSRSIGIEHSNTDEKVSINEKLVVIDLPIIKTNETTQMSNFDVNTENKTYVGDHFNRIVQLIQTKKFALPNFNKIDRWAIKRQINWLRSTLGLSVKTLPENIALEVIKLIKTLDIEELKKKS